MDKTSVVRSAADTVARVRWQNLFDDLEGQWASEADAEQLEVLAEEERLRVARLGLRDRLVALGERAGVGDAVAVQTVSGERLRVTLSAFGRDWIAGEREAGGARSVLLPLAGIAAVDLDPRNVAATLSGSRASAAPVALAERLGVAVVLRDLCRRRCAIEALAAGERRFGRVDRVGRDHFDLAEHPAGEPEAETRRVRLVAFATLEYVAF